MRYTASNIVIFSISIYNIDVHVARVHIFSGKFRPPCTDGRENSAKAGRQYSRGNFVLDFKHAEWPIIR